MKLPDRETHLDKTILALLTGGGIGAVALIIQQLMVTGTARKANEIANAKLLLEKQDALWKQEDAERKDRQTEEAARRAELTEEADRYHGLWKREEDQHEETRRELEAMRLHCRRKGDLCQVDVGTKREAGGKQEEP